MDHIKAWQNYDETRNEYEFCEKEWKNARTTAIANNILPEVLKARDEYEQALTTLRGLGYEPRGNDPWPTEKFKKE